ncbi:MAG: hypothetical protein A2667_03400 [Candidatus Wildermuthbacteria bacterium RIFCSPHIGHO2_01_FULL_47_27]|uniref:HotDog ACOT-type domain-containing protein n=2 Tax=Candidatus Wildermuthiibacteriota TaxID=1817923 RepID=A0A1G2RSU0_9BACT|nr:MAG: hypothetical protein A2667_03400 [Candidatus Wildermuthbacteria bacterium RIFCSPHIGHO2_01_FULL_47_27]OHA67623.1 MAG: hypothetical protein A3D59_03585 [Candidatus Wildermuthbacteria bacterium RIFCSPHIGHO2_02_FULL_47_17]OHA75915.1 MAG: hypothetical protein A3A32_02370 [Candidatus Wildermuthbacteria bacterium RIFCSPLOWO2_01_FULL_48_35]
MKAKPVSASALDNQVHGLTPKDFNSSWTMSGGVVTALLDEKAGAVVRRHSGMNCVTLSFDNIRFKKPVSCGLLIFNAAINRVWDTSCEVGVKVFVEYPGADLREHIASAYCTFVTGEMIIEKVELNGVAIQQPRFLPKPMPKVVPCTKEQRRRWREANERRAKRLAAAKN